MPLAHISDMSLMILGDAHPTYPPYATAMSASSVNLDSVEDFCTSSEKTKPSPANSLQALRGVYIDTDIRIYIYTYYTHIIYRSYNIVYMMYIFYTYYIQTIYILYTYDTHIMYI